MIRKQTVADVGHWRLYSTRLQEKTNVTDWDDTQYVTFYLKGLMDPDNLDIRHMDDWYGVTATAIRKLRGKGLLKKYKHLYYALLDCFPNHAWQQWRFACVPEGYWLSSDNIHQYLEWLAEQLNIAHPNQWYQVSPHDVTTRCGSTLIHHYASLPTVILQEYPEYDWTEWRKKKVPEGFWNKNFWDNVENVKTYFKWVEPLLNITHWEQWYEIHSEDLRNYHGKPLTTKFGSLCVALMTTFPELPWQFWKFIYTPEHLWAEEKLAKEYLEWLASQLSVNSWTDWYTVPTSTLDSRATNLIKRFGSWRNVLAHYYPEHTWDWRFANDVKVIWDEDFARNPSKIKIYLEWLCAQLHINRMEDWYEVTSDQLEPLYGNCIITSFGGLHKFLQCAYHGYKWEFWRFPKVPFGAWEDPENLKQYRNWLSQDLDIKNMEDWYQVSADAIIARHGTTLLMMHGGFAKTMKFLFPEYEWQMWRFGNNLPDSFWDDREMVRPYLNWLQTQLPIKQPEDWYNITREHFSQFHGSGILIRYGSVGTVVSTFYPEYAWKLWLFNKVPDGFWENADNVVVYLEWLSQHLKVSSAEDWYSVNGETIEKVPGASFISMKGGLMKLLALYFPEYPWDIQHVTNTSKPQEAMFNALKALLPEGTVILMSYRHPKLMYSQTKQKMELDVYVPSMSLALEYQGEQHYHKSYWWTPLIKQQIKDIEKRDACKLADITLLEIPYWWNRSEHSLRATLHQFMPQIFPNDESCEPIPLEKPTKQ